MSVNSSTGNRETSTLAAREVSGPHREGDEPKPMMHGDEGSDSAMSHCEASERGRATGGGVGGAKGGGQGERATGRHAPDTEPARRVPRPGTRTANRQAEEGGTVNRAPAPVDGDQLREAYLALKREAAPGVDGVTWEDYGHDLEVRLVDLHGRIHRGAYRAQPSRRRFIPKPDGRQRPLGIAALEDKIVQRALVEVLNATLRGGLPRVQLRVSPRTRPA